MVGGAFKTQSVQNLNNNLR